MRCFLSAGLLWELHMSVYILLVFPAKFEHLRALLGEPHRRVDKISPSQSLNHGLDLYLKNRSHFNWPQCPQPIMQYASTLRVLSDLNCEGIG